MYIHVSSWLLVAWLFVLFLLFLNLLTPSSIILWLLLTNRYTCRPKYNQEVEYNGYYKGHGLKFQGITTPSGILHLYGPTEGRVADAEMLRESKVLEVMAAHPGFTKRIIVRGEVVTTKYFLYGDPAYPVLEHMQAPYKAPSRRCERIYNQKWSRVRIVIEQLFGEVTKLWESNNLKIQQKIFLSPVSMHYIVSVILTNIYTCIQGSNIVSRYFDTEDLVPDLDTYLQQHVEEE